MGDKHQNLLALARRQKRLSASSPESREPTLECVQRAGFEKPVPYGRGSIPCAAMRRPRIRRESEERKVVD